MPNEGSRQRYKIAKRCGDHKGAGLASDDVGGMGNHLELVETMRMSEELHKLLAGTQQTAVRVRFQRSVANTRHPLKSNLTIPPEK